MSRDITLSDAHWDFALAVYSSPGVADSCVRLQDLHGVDVNVLLLALFANASFGVSVEPDHVAALDMIASPIRETVVSPLRQVRRAMKGRNFGTATESVRERVKAAELVAEQLEQAALAQVVSQWPGTRAPFDPESVVLHVVRYFGGNDPVEPKLIAPIVVAVETVRT